MSTYAIVSNGVIQNKVLADTAADLSSFPSVYELSDDTPVDIGWVLSGENFIPPPSPPRDPVAVSIEIRKERSRLLTTFVDPFVLNALRWAEMTTEQQAEVANYRRALLDITDQEGFPLNVVWPPLPYFV